MAELSHKARAYLDAFAQEHQAPALPPYVPPAPVPKATWKLAIAFGLAAAVAAGVWGLAGPTRFAPADAESKSLAAAHHEANRPSGEYAASDETDTPERPVRRERDGAGGTFPEPDSQGTADAGGRAATEQGAAAAGSSPAPTKPQAAKPRANVRPVRPRGPSALRRELALVDAAKAALRGGDLAAARRSLEKHAAAFPNGLLAPERDRLTKRIERRRKRLGASIPPVSAGANNEE